MLRLGTSVRFVHIDQKTLRLPRNFLSQLKAKQFHTYISTAKLTKVTSHFYYHAM